LFFITCRPSWSPPNEHCLPLSFGWPAPSLLFFLAAFSSLAVSQEVVPELGTATRMDLGRRRRTRGDVPTGGCYYVNTHPPRNNRPNRSFLATQSFLGTTVSFSEGPPKVANKSERKKRLAPSSCAASRVHNTALKRCDIERRWRTTRRIANDRGPKLTHNCY
jgi:hypothetical protein